MSEQTKKAEKIEQKVEPAELSEQELDKVAGGKGTVGPPPPPSGPFGHPPNTTQV